MPRPIVFLDVDGTLIPFRARRTAAPDDTGNPLLGRLDPEDGRRLPALAHRVDPLTGVTAADLELVADFLNAVEQR